MLATSTIIYDTVGIVEYTSLAEYCKETIRLVASISEIAFVVLEIILMLNLSKVFLTSITEAYAVILSLDA